MSETRRFTEDILGAAKLKADSIIAEAEIQSQQAMDEASADLSREGDAIIRTAKAEAESIKLREVSEARHKFKLQEQREKSKILSEVLEAAKRRTEEITKDENKYPPYLAGFIASGINELGSETVLVHMTASDLKRVDKGKLEREVTKMLQKPVKLEWSREPIAASGGAIISTTDGKARIVNTLDERFEALESKLLIAAGKYLFT